MVEMPAQQAADQLRVSRPTLGKLVQTGQLTARAERHGTRTYLYVEDTEVQRYAAAHPPRRRHPTRDRDFGDRLDRLETAVQQLRDTVERRSSDVADTAAPHPGPQVDRPQVSKGERRPAPLSPTTDASRAFEDLMAFTSAMLDADRHGEQAERLTAQAAVARQQADSHRREALRIAHSLLTEARWQDHLPGQQQQ